MGFIDSTFCSKSLLGRIILNRLMSHQAWKCSGHELNLFAAKEKPCKVGTGLQGFRGFVRREQSSLSDFQPRRRSAHDGRIDVALELGKVVNEHTNQFAGLSVIGCLVGPG